MSGREDDSGGVTFADATCIHATPQAMRVRLTRTVNGRETVTEAWVPKACVHDDSEVFDARDNARGKLVVKQWWAEREGWV